MQSQRYRERWVQLAGGNSGMPAAEGAPFVAAEKNVD